MRVGIKVLFLDDEDLEGLKMGYIYGEQYTVSVIHLLDKDGKPTQENSAIEEIRYSVSELPEEKKALASSFITVDNYKLIVPRSLPETQEVIDPVKGDKRSIRLDTDPGVAEKENVNAAPPV